MFFKKKKPKTVAAASLNPKGLFGLQFCFHIFKLDT